jgi:hypothetical protein
VLLSHIILAGVREYVRVDVGRERVGLTLAEHLFFWKTCTLPFNCVVVLSCFVFVETCEGGAVIVYVLGRREERCKVRRTTRESRETVTLSFYFLCFVRNYEAVYLNGRGGGGRGEQGFFFHVQWCRVSI